MIKVSIDLNIPTNIRIAAAHIYKFSHIKKKYPHPQSVTAGAISMIYVVFLLILLLVHNGLH